VPERILHLFLFMNLGVLLLLVGSALLGWSDAPTGLARVDYGSASWLLTVFALLSLGWAVRDGLNAAFRDKKQQRAHSR
jgi:hypothetical protein